MTHRAQAEWFGRDHALVMQAAGALEDTPDYAKQLWESADDAPTAALYLLNLLTKERAEAWGVNDSDRETAAYAAGYDDGLEDAGAERRDD